MLSAKVTPARTDVPRSYASCALVGNGPGMYLPGMGEIVDRHDAVFKFNLYNLAQRAGKCVRPRSRSRENKCAPTCCRLQV